MYIYINVSNLFLSLSYNSRPHKSLLYPVCSEFVRVFMKQNLLFKMDKMEHFEVDFKP